MKIPTSCCECPFDRNCMNGMYTQGCAFYKPEDRPVNAWEKLKRLFKKGK